MNYKVYKLAAKKHKFACEEILKLLENKIRNNEHRKQMILTLYYLSGYIIECIAKFAIFDLVGFSNLEDVKKLNKNGISFDRDIKHHKFVMFEEQLNRLAHFDIPMIKNKKGISKEVKDLYRKWDSEVRYTVQKIHEDQHYIEFFDQAVKIFETIIIRTKN